MKNRIVSLLLILTICLTFLGGCGASQDDVPDLDVTKSSTQKGYSLRTVPGHAEIIQMIFQLYAEIDIL